MWSCVWHLGLYVRSRGSTRCRSVGILFDSWDKRWILRLTEREKRTERELQWGIGSRGWTRRCRWSPATLCSAVEVVDAAHWWPAAALPVAHSSPWLVGREVGRVGLTGYCSSWPPPPLYGAARRGPATPVGGLPRSGSWLKGPVDPPFGPTGGDQH
jgi:hypothetical protein